MISTLQRTLLAALATTLLILDPTSAFFVAAPASSAASAATARRHSPSSLGLDSGLLRASARGQGGYSRGVGAPLAMSADTAVEQKGLVTVYHKETCPYCKKALELLEGGYSLQVTRVNVLEGDDSEKKIKQMKTFSGRNTVPQIFFNSEHLGGNDDLQKLHEEGKLEGLVAKVRDEAPGMMKATWYHPWY